MTGFVGIIYAISFLYVALLGGMAYAMRGMEPVQDIKQASKF